MVAALAATTVLGACGSGDSDGSRETDDPTARPADTTPEALPTADVSTPEPGAAHVAMGATLDVVLDVTTCTVALDAEPDGEVPSEQVVIEAAGDADGVPVALSVRRYRSRGASPTITDTVRVTRGPVDAPVSVVEAQRFEVDGLVTDPRDPDADDPLLRVTAAGIEARGVFAPPGSFAEDGGLVEGSVAVVCDG